MRLAPTPKNPAFLTYYALRKTVGFVALFLPFALAIPWFLWTRVFQTSISSYYYTGMRNLFVGSLGAIALFMLFNRGYDLSDKVAGIFSGICAVGVAFFPTTPNDCPTPQQHCIGIAHWTFAALLFLTLAYFCLFLFTMSAVGQPVTEKKRQRNRVYIVCGCVILLSLVLILVFKLCKKPYLLGCLGSDFCFETTSLLAFGVAWLVKGKTFLRDE